MRKFNFTLGNPLTLLINFEERIRGSSDPDAADLVVLVKKPTYLIFVTYITYMYYVGAEFLFIHDVCGEI